jgi:putative transposase
MRPPRLKLDANREEAYYHCISRTAGAAWLLEDSEKEVFRKQLWMVLEYCGLELVTYAIMSNHYHVLVKVPRRRAVGDSELLRLYELLYPERKNAMVSIRRDMESNGDLAQRWRARQMRQMFDISEFNKLLKMRFSIWFNHEKERKGTLWEGRFTSVLVETGEALRTVAGYIDANAVKAGIVDDPKDYRFCGYAEAVAGKERARKGLQDAYGFSWTETELRHRCLLYGALYNKRRLDSGQVQQVLKEKRELSVQDALRCKIRYFVAGHILGSHEYVARVARELMAPRPVRGCREPNPVTVLAEWKALAVLSPMRSNLFG